MTDGQSEACEMWIVPRDAPAGENARAIAELREAIVALSKRVTRLDDDARSIDQINRRLDYLDQKVGEIKVGRKKIPPIQLEHRTERG